MPAAEEELAGHSLLPAYGSAEANQSPAKRSAVFSGRERHSSSRYNSLGYPCRCIRTKTHLYIRNFTPERWPAGAAQKYDLARFDARGQLITFQLGQPHAGYHDIDDGPTLRWMIAHRSDALVGRRLAAAVDLRPAEELYDITADPGCLNNLAESAAMASTKQQLAGRLADYLRATGDLRQTDPDAAHVWETYPRVSGIRWFPVPQWATANPQQVPEQAWLDERRPR